MVAYKGKTAGNLRQYIKNKPDKRGFKLFERASEDGFICDMVLYQGKTTLEAHDVPLTPEQKVLGATSQIVAVLASTMSSPTIAIFADNFFYQHGNQRSELQVHRDSKGQQNQKSSTQVHQGDGEEGCTP